MILRVLVRAEYRQIQGLHPLCSRSGGFLHLPSSYLPPKTHTLLSVPDESRAEPGQTNPLTAVWILYFQNGPQNKEIPQRHEQKWNFRHLQWPQRVLTPQGHLVLSRFWHSCCCLSLSLCAGELGQRPKGRLYVWLQGLPAKLDKARTCHIHTLTQMASLGIFRGKFYEQKRGSWEKQGTFSAFCSTTPRKSYVFSSLISLSPPSLKPMTSKILFNWQVSILVLPEWEYGIRACLWNTPFSLGSWDTSCSWFTTKCSGYSFLGLFAGSSSPWPLTMRH